MNYENRRAIIVDSANEALRVTANWIRDLQKSDAMVLSEYVLMSMKNMIINCEGDVPDECRDLYMAIRRFSEEFHQYTHQYDGKVQQNGSPVGSFWAALSLVQQEAMKTDVQYVQQLESVQELRTQKVSDDQIANHIYGRIDKVSRKAIGPFINSMGQVNKRLIDQAAKGIDEQNVILKAAGWPEVDGSFYPPWQLQQNTSRHKEVEDRLRAYRILEEGPKQASDPRSIEEMLEDGCYVQIIEKYKRVTRNEVLDIAKRLNIEPQDQPGFAKVVPRVGGVGGRGADIEYTKSQPETQLPVSANIDSPPLETVSQKEPLPPMNPEVIQGLQAPTETLERDLIAIRACVKGNPTFGEAEVREQLEAEGVPVSTEDINRVLREEQANKRKSNRKP